MKKCLSVALLLLPLLSAVSAQKKFIGHSWDLLNASPQLVAEHIQAFEKLPLDGITLTCRIKTPDNKMIDMRQTMMPPRWEKAWLEPLAPALKTISSGKMKDNFLTILFAPRKRIAWDDDAAWEIAAHNMALGAWLAKSTGMRGLLMDPEDYPRTRQYDYMADVDKGTFWETYALARKRGRQMMTAIASEFPDAVVFSFWFLSMKLQFLDQNIRTRDMMASSGYLWAGFINGLLDAATPRMKLVDGTEHGYHYRAENFDFYRYGLGISRELAKLVEPENLVKFRSQMQQSFGLYLDMYTNPETSRYYFPPLNGSRLKRLVTNFSQAMAVCDEYCWVYGEKYTWIDWGKPMGPRINQQTWNDVLPGLYSSMDMIRNSKQMLQALYEKHRANGTLVNIAPNPACDPKMPPQEKFPVPGDWENANLPAGWFSWQCHSNGTFSTDMTRGHGDSCSVKMANVSTGSLILPVPVIPGEAYAVEAFAQTNCPKAKLSIRWLKNGLWMSTDFDISSTFAATEDNAGWLKAGTMFFAPASVTHAVILLSSRQQDGQWSNFDDIKCYKLTSATND